MEGGEEAFEILRDCCILKLPDELLLYVFRCIKFNRFTLWRDLSTLELTCRKFYDLLRRPNLWRPFKNFRLVITGLNGLNGMICGQICGQYYENIPLSKIIAFYLVRVPVVQSFSVQFTPLAICDDMATSDESMLFYDVIRANKHKFELSNITVIVPDDHNFLFISNALLSLNLVNLAVESASILTEGSALWPLIRASTLRLQEFKLKLPVADYPTMDRMRFKHFFSTLNCENITSLTLDNISFVKDCLLLSRNYTLSWIFTRYRNLVLLRLSGSTARLPHFEDDLDRETSFNTFCRNVQSFFLNHRTSAVLRKVFMANLYFNLERFLTFGLNSGFAVDVQDSHIMISCDKACLQMSDY